MNFTPLGKRVLVEKLEEETKTASGIIIPDNAKEKPLSGTVVAISDEVKKEGQISLKDKVIFGKYAGNELKLGDKEYSVMNTEDILGILK